MPRIRTLKPEHTLNHKIGYLSDRAYRIWAALLVNADDEGRGPLHADEVRAKVYAFQPAVKVADVEAAVHELTAAHLVYVYAVGGKSYYQIHDWDEHQKIQHPGTSKFPPCTPEKHSVSPESDPDPPTIHESSRILMRNLSLDSPLVTPESSRTFMKFHESSGIPPLEKVQQNQAPHESSGILMKIHEPSWLIKDQGSGIKDQGSKTLSPNGERAPHAADSAAPIKKSAADPRTDSPEIRLYRQLRGHNPPKETYARVIRILAGKTYAQVFPYLEDWRALGRNPENLAGWLGAVERRVLTSVSEARGLPPLPATRRVEELESHPTAERPQ